MLEEYKKEITKLLWKIPKMELVIVNNILKLMDTEMRAWDYLRSLKENESVLEKTVGDEAVRLALKVYEKNK